MLGKTTAKYIQSLYHKKFRDEHGVFVIEGPRIVNEFIRFAPDLINDIYAIDSWMDEHKDLLRNIVSSKLKVITADELKKISSLTTPNQVLSLVRKRESNLNPLITSKITLLLDGIRDPGNMGTIVRIADWFGIGNMVCSTDCADLYNPKVVQSTMGSMLRVNVIYEDPANFIRRSQPIVVIASTLDGEDLYKTRPVSEALLLVGNESAGIRKELLELSNHTITIPRKGGAESLNAAVATGIILSHLLKPLT
jgi:RNA methyltransferase, TrmH family